MIVDFVIKSTACAYDNNDIFYQRNSLGVNGSGRKFYKYWVT